MKIRTIEKLEDKIDQDLAWRKFELLKLKLAMRHEDVPLGRETLLRASIALLCAHWEGFVRSVANYYVVYIIGQKISNKLLTDNFYALTLKKDIISSGKSAKNSVHVKLLEKIGEDREKNFFIRFSDSDGERIINTDSNLSYELFAEILKSINIDNIYQTKQNYIDSEMLKNRHSVVHGEKINLEEFNYDETYEQVIGIMENFKEQVLHAASNMNYLKTLN